jgi:hypothetical protein
MAHNETIPKTRRTASRMRKLGLIGICLLAVLPTAALVLATVERLQDASDRSK